MALLPFSSKLDWGSYIISITKANLKRTLVFIHSMKFLSPEVALYLCKSTIWPCVEYCCHVWASAPSCYLKLLDKLQKRVCRTFGSSLVAFLGPLAYRRNVARILRGRLREAAEMMNVNQQTYVVSKRLDLGESLLD